MKVRTSISLEIVISQITVHLEPKHAAEYMLYSSSMYIYLTGVFCFRLTKRKCLTALLHMHLSRACAPSDGLCRFLPVRKGLAELLVLGTFAKLLKATVRLRLVCLSVLIEQLGAHWTDFCEIWCVRI